MGPSASTSRRWLVSLFWVTFGRRLHNPLNRKSISLHCEMMLMPSLFETADIAAQGKLLAKVARLVDAGRAKGQIVLEGF
jgi:hypothetical protein